MSFSVECAKNGDQWREQTYEKNLIFNRGLGWQ